MTAQLAAQLTGPAIIVLITVFGVPLLVGLLRLLGTKAAAIDNAHFRTLATDAVRAVEQTMAQAPSAQKKATATGILIGVGVPATLAGTLVEAAVHALNEAATQVLTTMDAPATVTVTAPTPAAGPAIETPAGPPSTRLH